MKLWRTTSSKTTSAMCAGAHNGGRIRLGAILALASVLLLFPASLEAIAQRKFTKTYPSPSNVRVQLKNWSGTIRVEVWNQNKVEIRSEMDSGMEPVFAQSGGVIEIGVQHNNSRNPEMGDANFQIHVPVNATVDLETRQGNIIVRGVQGDLVRAEISTRGDIELTEINAAQVVAHTRGGDIFFAGILAPSGTYKFAAMEGDVRLRLPRNAQFSLDARAPTSRNIDLGSFAGSFNRGDGRRITGSVGSGNASCDVMSMRGSIFILR